MKRLESITRVVKTLLAFWAGGAVVTGTMALVQFPATGRLFLLNVALWPYAA